MLTAAESWAWFSSSKGCSWHARTVENCYAQQSLSHASSSDRKVRRSPFLSDLFAVVSCVS